MRFIRDQTRSRGKSSLIFYQGFLSIPGLSMTHFVASVNTKVIIRTKQSLTHTFERDGPPGKGLHTITWRVVIPLFVSLRTEGSINRNRVRETKGHLSRKISNSRAIATTSECLSHGMAHLHSIYCICQKLATIKQVRREMSRWKMTVPVSIRCYPVSGMMILTPVVVRVAYASRGVTTEILFLRAAGLGQRE